MPLTDLQRKKVVADYIETKNYSETGRRNHISDKSVKRILEREDMQEVTKKVEEKKEQNTQDILEYIESKHEEKKRVIDLSLQAIEKILKSSDKLNVKDIATAYGIILDKDIKIKEMQISNKTATDGIDKVCELLNKIEQGAKNE